MGLPLAFGWRHLLFLNWPMKPEELASRVPDALELHEFDGSAWVSVVPFTNVNIRPRGLPARVGIDVPELNVRTYVARDGEPGVYFFSLDAQDLLTVIGARVTHHLPYFYARGQIRGADGGISFESRRFQPGDPPARCALAYSPTGEQFSPDAGSRAEFLTERRRLYTEASDGSLRYTDVRHPPWTLRRCRVQVAENTMFEANRLPRPETDPIAYYSAGVEVVTGRSKRWE